MHLPLILAGIATLLRLLTESIICVTPQVDDKAAVPAFVIEIANAPTTTESEIQSAPSMASTTNHELRNYRSISTNE